MADKAVTTSRTHIPPHDIEAEKSVLGSLLIDKDAIVKVVEFLRPHHFYKTGHEDIYQAIFNLYEKREPADLVTVPGELKKLKKLTSAGGVAYLTELVNSVPTAANVEHYAEIIRDEFIKRSLLTVAAEIGELTFDEPDVDKLLDIAEQKIYSIYYRTQNLHFRNRLVYNFCMQTYVTHKRSQT